MNSFLRSLMVSLTICLLAILVRFLDENVAYWSIVITGNVLYLFGFIEGRKW